MRKQIIRILDRTPTGSRGQSLLELSITLPIFFILLLGLVEIGWLANNYLTLIDVSREAGRYGSVRDIYNWFPGEELTYQHMDCDDRQESYNTTGEDIIATYPGPTLPGYTDGVDDAIDFYDGVACTVIKNLAPLEFKDDQDDIVVSVFAYAILDISGTPTVVITGRFPSKSNECSGEREPFNPPGINPTMWDTNLSDAGADGQRGYLFRGNHINEDGCRGSEFSLTEMEDLLNRTLLSEDDQPLESDEIKEIPNNGIVLVEIFWRHEQLLGVPFFAWAGRNFHCMSGHSSLPHRLNPLPRLHHKER